jgi:ATP/maltotriose-dependent transcriptional regulator MalT
MGEWVQIQRQYVAVYTKMAQWLGVDFTRYPGAMEAEWSNLTAAFEMALEQEQYGEAAFQLACLVPYMMSKGWIGEIDHRYERLKPYHDELPAEIRGHLDRSQVQRYSATGDWRTAHRFNERVFANERITAEVRAFALLDESRIRYVMGDLEGAAESLRKSSEIGARLKNPFLQAENLMARADVLEAQGYTEAALACWSDLAEMSAAAGNSVQTAVALREAARLSVVLGRLEVARQLLRQALENAYGGASPVVECATLSELGELLLALDEPEDVEFIGRRMLVLLEEMSLRERETGRRKGIAMGLLARAARRLGRLDEALDRAREMVGLFERSQAGPRSLAYAWWLMYETYVSRGEMEEASQALGEADRLWFAGEAYGRDRRAGG